jgi:hypothetical protein
MEDRLPAAELQTRMLGLAGYCQSGRQDLNLRPPGPQPGALPDCATPRGPSDSTPGESGRRESNPFRELGRL